MTSTLPPLPCQLCLIIEKSESAAWKAMDAMSAQFQAPAMTEDEAVMAAIVNSQVHFLVYITQRHHMYVLVLICVMNTLKPDQRPFDWVGYCRTGGMS